MQVTSQSSTLGSYAFSGVILSFQRQVVCYYQGRQKSRSTVIRMPALKFCSLVTGYFILLYIYICHSTLVIKVLPSGVRNLADFIKNSDFVILQLFVELFNSASSPDFHFNIYLTHVILTSLADEEGWKIELFTQLEKWDWDLDSGPTTVFPLQTVWGP